MAVVNSHGGLNGKPAQMHHFNPYAKPEADVETVVVTPENGNIGLMRKAFCG